MKNFKDIPLLITCSVNPVAKVAISNPVERLLQYKSSIYRWAVETNFNKLVIIDNTNVKVFNQNEIDRLNDYGLRVEQICMAPNLDVKIRGTSYGIAEIYETAIFRSELIDENTHFAKITGRLFVENTEDLISNIEYNSSYLLRWLSKGTFRFRPGRFDERFGVYNKDFYINKLLPLKSKLDESKGNWIEIIYNELLEEESSSIKSFNVYPRIVGISGHHRKPYDGNKFLTWKTKDILNNFFKVLKY